ncbi:carbohydrate kinase [Dyella caseinilytica]|uniref:Carbohydrate kinase n=1 Tax=Dyella caseinilytica TaxID=1849581 RepID=A0ABX7GY54_9GAMM|nr:carbohydrate kinase [Dyella caseinilytica]QRN55386.1 carbohydrate kinase [Dyella caseinilytica]GGA01325.1 hypothetical protein GCM10011408_23240 [Dyella caseinilytica]
MSFTFIYANNVNTTLAGPLSSTGTQFNLSSTLNVPTSIPSGAYWVVSLQDAATGQESEIIYVGSISGATCSNLLRAQEGTAALSWNTGDFAYSGITAGQMENFAPAGVFTNQQIYATPGTYTFTAPANVYKVFAIGTAGGGGGSGCEATSSSQTFSGGGGGAGGTCMGFYDVMPGEEYTVTVGAGGDGIVGPGSGAFGGNTSFSTFFIASAGQGGQFNTSTSQAGGEGGGASGGQINIVGGYGCDGQQGTFLLTAAGGASYWGGGGRSGNNGGISGTAYGSGGGGAYDIAFSGLARAGGNGQGGILVLQW